MQPKMYQFSRWDLIGISRIRGLLSVVIGTIGNVEVTSTKPPRGWTMVRVVQHRIGTYVLLYAHLCCFNFTWWTIQWKQENFIILAISSRRCPWFIIKCTKYEAITTPNNGNGCTLFFALGIKIWCIPTVPWYLI